VRAGVLDFSLSGGDTGNFLITESLGVISAISGSFDGSTISGLIPATVCVATSAPPGHSCTGGFGGNDNLYTGTSPYFDRGGLSFNLTSPDKYGFVYVNLSEAALGGPGITFGTCQSNSITGCPGTGDLSVLDAITQVALLPVQGGTTSAPVSLVSGLPIGTVTGTIGGLGTEDYYTFFWGGGAFSATATVSGASSLASYLFSEGAPGSCNNSSVTLSSPGFTGTLSGNLAPGYYCIGLDANNVNDPDFSLTFNTPVGGVPEPTSFALLLSAGLGMIGVRRLKKRHR
jgi:hypothetical protein